VVEIQADTLKIEICAPERRPAACDATEVILPGSEGVFTVLPGHTPLLATLGTGVMTVFGVDRQEQFYALNGGFAEVNQDHVVVLTDTAESEHEIDVARAEAARDRAERRLKQREEAIDMARAEAALQRALARLAAKRQEGY
jgi:F-type H+-transporting ATPase subunit epsilon